MRNKKLIEPSLIDLEKQFTESLGTRVQILKTDYGGRVTIDYFSQEDLDHLLELVAKREAAPVAAASAIDTLANATALEAVPDAPAPEEEVYTKYDELENTSSEEVPAASAPITDIDDFSTPRQPETPAVASEQPKEKEEDDADLYSIKNFGI